MTVAGDQQWKAVATYLRERRLAAERVIAPRELGELVPGVVPYDRLGAGDLGAVEAVVVHKGLLHEIGNETLRAIVERFAPAFANEVFVVLHRGPAVPGVPRSPHYLAFTQALGAQAPGRALSLADSMRHKLEALKKRAAAALARPATQPTSRPAIYLGDHRALTRTAFGHKMYVDTRDTSLAPHILLDGYWESWITAVFRELVKPGMTVVDVGANIGYYSVLAADAVGEGGHVHAFEANPDLAEILFANLEVNGFFERSSVVSKAVYAQSTKVELNRYRKHWGSSSLWATEAHALAHGDSLDKVQVEAIALDDYLQPGARVDVLKIDAEGAEPFVLEGALRVLADNPRIHILLEFAPAILAVSWSAKALYDLTQQLGFRLFRISTESELVPSTFEELMRLPSCDVLLHREP